MKSIVLSVSVIVLIAIGVVISSLTVSGTLSIIEDEVDEYSNLGDFEKVTADFSRMLENYKAKTPFLSLFIRDALIYDIEKSFLDIISYAEAEDISGVMSAKARLHADIEEIRGLTEISLKSIF